MRYYLLLLFVLSSTLQYGQYVMNLGLTQSPLRTISQKIGYTEVQITYSSPSVKNRTIWGTLEPYDEVWRAGANYATTISFSENVIIDDQDIDRGTYSFFVIPRDVDEWTLILNAVPKQWGAFSYNPGEDVIRLNVRPTKANHQEQLRYEIESNDSKEGKIVLRWEETQLGFNFKTILKESLESLLNENLETASNESKWMNYLQASEILLNEKESLSTAMRWINKAEELSTVEMDWNPQFAPKEYVMGHLYWIKAQLHAMQGDYKIAASLASKMKEIEGQKFYKRNKDADNIDTSIASWKKN